MKGLALVVGSGGIGKQLATDLSNLFNDLDVILCGRTKAHESFWELDIENDNSLIDLKNRIYSLDLLRGFAVLGILIMNITSFSQISMAYVNPTVGGGLEGYNQYFQAFNYIFADTRFMSIFSILFGAGVVLFSKRIEAKGKRVHALHYKRMFWLLVFGLIHAYFIWAGDILVAYAICGSFVFFFRKK